MRNAVIYCRISDDREGRQLGVQRQEEDCRALADRLGYTVSKVHIENDVSASTRSKKPRPLYEQMMRDAEDGQAAAVICYSSSRLTRRPLENERLIALYEQHGVRIHYANANDNDLSTARGRRRARDDAARDAEEAEEIGERVRRTLRQRRENGHAAGGPRAYGWQPDGIRLDPYEHGILTAVAQMVLAGETLRSVCADLTAHAVPTATWHPPLVLKPWAQVPLRRMLTAPRAAGYTSHDGEIVTRGEWEPAFDEQTWLQLRELLLDPARTTVQTARRNLLVGIALCGVCDRPVTSNIAGQASEGTRHRRYHCKACGLYRAMASIDAYVEGFVVALLEGLDDEPEPGADPEAQARCDALRERIDAELDAYADDDNELSRDEHRRVVRRLKDRLKAEQTELTPPRRRHLVRDVTGPNAEDRWSQLTLDRKRAIIADLVEVRLLRNGTGKRVFRPETVEITRR